VRQVKQSRAVATRDNIVMEAARLFAMKGYHDTKLEEVFRGAGVTTGAFFYHFKSKEDLGFAVIDAHMEKRRQELNRIEREMSPSPEADPLQRLMSRLDAIQEMARRRRKHMGGCMIGNLSTALSDTHNGFRRRLAQCFDEMAREFKPHLDLAAKQYRPGHDLDTRALAHYIVGVVEGSIMLARTGRDRRLIEKNFDFAKNHIRSLLQARK
jgi:TetR/AcrR family transcriptional regulator, transcriptional repressor for nem operon